MPRKNILTLLQGGDRRTMGRSDQVAEMVSGDAKLFPKLITGLWSAEALVRMRAADAAEKVTRKHRGLLQPYKDELPGLMAETQEQESRWHLAVLVPRLELNARERQVAISSLHRYLEDRSSIFKTFALQGLVDLVKDEPGIRSKVIDDRYSAPSHSPRYSCDESPQPQTTGSVGTRLADSFEPASSSTPTQALVEAVFSLVFSPNTRAKIAST